MPFPSTPTSVLRPALSRLAASSSSSAAPKLDAASVLATLSSYSNDWPRALDFFHWVPHSHHTPSTLAAAVDILGKHFEFDRAWLLIHAHPPPLLSHSALRSLFNRLAAAHLVPDALSAFDRAAAFQLRDLTSYHLLIDALCDHRHVVEAADLSIYSPSPPFPPDTKIYNMILRGWLKMQFWSKCRDFWDEMDRKGIEKDLHSYSIYMHIHAKSGKPWKALKLYKEIKREGRVSLDVVAYNTVIQAAGLVGGPDQSVRMYREMLDSGCQPNVVTFNVIIKMLCREGRVNEGYAFLDRMRRKGCEPNVITYHCFFQYSTRPKEILLLFDRMVASGCRPRMDTYVMLMKKFGRWGFLRPVFVVWGKMEEHGVSADAFAYNALIDALLQKGMVELAQKYDEEMLAKGLSAKPRKELGTKGLGDVVLSDEDNAFGGIF